jgi:hypothetical protein
MKYYSTKIEFSCRFYRSSSLRKVIVKSMNVEDITFVNNDDPEPDDDMDYPSEPMD